MSTAAHRFLTFVNASPSPYHAVEEASKRLKASGFEKITEDNPWKLLRSGKYFFTRNRTTLLAFVIGGKFTSGNGARVIGAHTDSPVLRVKPRSVASSSGFLQVGVETYGGGLWHTWFDRDLGLAGSVFTRQNDTYQSRLVRIDRPILRIPTLAIHLNTERDAFKFNNQTHLLPILASTSKDLNEAPSSEAGKADHSSVLLQLLSKELDCAPADIKELDLSLYDVQPSVLGGAHNEFVLSARLDNLMSSFCSIEALLQTSTNEEIANDNGIQIAILFDHEEIGSVSERGASSNLLDSTMSRITGFFQEKDDTRTDLFEVAIRKSFLISADMAHACHPNYSEKHEPNHRPSFHGGVVLKRNANQRYATSSPGAVLIHEIARKYNVPIQEFVVRNDSPCGSTIGPILSSKGIRTVDIGIPQLSMHSIREICGTDDVQHYINLMSGFFRDYDKVQSTIHDTD
jgi:aspartyl aminopeptidase